MAEVKDKFEKGYEPNFSYEVFTIKDVLKTTPPTYKTVDYFGGSFYEKELLI